VAHPDAEEQARSAPRSLIVSYLVPTSRVRARDAQIRKLQGKIHRLKEAGGNEQKIQTLQGNLDRLQDPNLETHRRRKLTRTRSTR